MMGSDRVIEDITVEIRKTSHADELRATCGSMPSYEHEIYGTSTKTPDTLRFYVGLSPAIKDAYESSDLDD